MSDDLTILRLKNPTIAAYIEAWRKQNEGRSFDLDDPRDQASFYEAFSEMGKHLAHTAQRASIKTVVSSEGVTTVFVNSTPRL